MNKDLKFITEHIENRMAFDDCFKEETMSQKAKKAFYAVWTNYIFINPTTENLRELKEEDYAVIKKLSYGAKNRLQSYIAFHLNKSHYELFFDDITNEDQAYSIIHMCEEVFNDTKILVDWWRNPVTDDGLTGEEWFKNCKEQFQKKKMIERVGFCFINMAMKKFLIVEDSGISWTTEQSKATRFNLRDGKTKEIMDQNLESTQKQVESAVAKLVSMDNMKIFHQAKEETANNLYVEM